MQGCRWSRATAEVYTLLAARRRAAVHVAPRAVACQRVVDPEGISRYREIHNFNYNNQHRMCRHMHSIHTQTRAHDTVSKVALR